MFDTFVATVLQETNILVIFNAFVNYSTLISSQNIMFNNEIYNKFIIMAAVHILFFGEVAGFKILRSKQRT